MEFHKYTMRPYPRKPRKPVLAHDGLKDAENYYFEMQAFEKEMEIYNSKAKEWNEEKYKKEEQFKQDCIEHFKLNDNPFGDKLFALAWDYGHSEGHISVYYHLENIMNFLFPKDN